MNLGFRLQPKGDGGDFTGYAEPWSVTGRNDYISIHRPTNTLVICVGSVNQNFTAPSTSPFHYSSSPLARSHRALPLLE